MLSTDASPWQTACVALSGASLHAAVHAFPGAGLPDQRERLEWKLNTASQLSEPLRVAALDALEKLPQGCSLCHGDFHPGNVLLVEGRARVIDWPDATCGHPLAEVARTAWLMVDSALPPDLPLPWLVQLLRRSFARSYLARYFECARAGSEVGSLASLIAARLSEGPSRTRQAVRRGKLMEHTDDQDATLCYVRRPADFDGTAQKPMIRT
jgi:aminoglycoside phosphotransferase (APT) family kinase protein